MDAPVFKDRFDWHGCEVVQYNPKKLGGRATIRNTRLDADTVLINFESGMTVEELVEDFGVSREDVEAVLAFAGRKQMQASA